MIGVCIKYFHENYGGMLQAYATVKMLEDRGIQYELIQYEKKYTLLRIIKSIPRLLNGVLMNDKYEAFVKKMGMKRHPEFYKNNAIRMKAFQSFKDSHFTCLSPLFKGYDELRKGSNRYEAVVTGSDQLWSPAGLPTNFYNLMFVPTNIKKISYASSFGVNKIPWYQKKRTAYFLRRIEFISMRENRGSEIVEELTGRKAPTILDPVFNFDSAGWNQLIPCEKIIDSPYIFAYFLGENQEHRDAVKQTAKKLGLKIVALRHMDQFVPEDERFGDFYPYDIGPDKFLSLLRGAEYICTDSFHGMCFSIIHQKKFVIFNRYSEKAAYSKNSRIDSLCKNLGLEQRRYDKEKALESQIASEIDYELVYQRLDILKERTENYLNRALEGLS